MNTQFKKFSLSLVLSLSMALLLSSCGSSSSSSSVVLGSLAFDRTLATIKQGSETELTLSLTGSYGQNGLGVSVSSSNEAVALVVPGKCSLSSEPGSSQICEVFVQGVANGTATISASANGYMVTPVTVIVQSGMVVPGTLSFSQTSENVTLGSSNNVRLSLDGSSGVSGLSVAIRSSKTQVATTAESTCTLSSGINHTCDININGVALGSATITAVATNYAVPSDAVTVINSSSKGVISFADTYEDLSTSGTARDLLSLSKSSGVSGVQVSLVSSDPAIATVSPSTCTLSSGASSARSCLVTIEAGNKQGSAQITATASGYDIAPVTVVHNPAKNQRYVNIQVPYGVTLNGYNVYVMDATLSKQVAFISQVTNVFPTPAGSPPLTPTAWTSLPIDSSVSTSYYLVAPTGSGYQGCRVTFNPDGLLNTSGTTCSGVGYTPNQNPDGTTALSDVTFYAIGTTTLSGSPAITKPIAGLLKNVVAETPVPRLYSFKNSTPYDLCLVNNKTAVNGTPSPTDMTTLCQVGSTDHPLVLSGSTYDYPITGNGLNSGGWYVSGYRTPSSLMGSAGAWVSTGVLSYVLPSPAVGLGYIQSATKTEPTIYPYYPSGVSTGAVLTSVGPSNVDVSNVDGVNLKFSFYPQTISARGPGICLGSYAANPLLPANQLVDVYSSAKPLSKSLDATPFPCPSGYGFVNPAGGQSTGCMSPSSYYNKIYEQNRSAQNQQNADQAGCARAYSAKSSCEAAANSPISSGNVWYVNAVHSAYKNTYAWAYDDMYGDFTCHPFASYVVEITMVGTDVVTLAPGP